MTANAVIKEASIFGPVASLTGTAYLDATGRPSKSAGAVRGVIRVATSTTRVDETLPVVADAPGNNSNRPVIPLQGKFLRLKNESRLWALEFAFGVGSAQAITYNASASFATGAVAAAWRLEPLEVIDVIVPPDATHLSHIQETGAAASTLAMYCSEGNVGDK